MKPRHAAAAALAVTAALLATFSVSSPAQADLLGGDGFSGGAFSPRVPVSALARPAAWFDASRLHLSSSITVGSGLGSGTNALQVTSLEYRFGAPLAMRVNLGNAWGGNAARGGQGFFLEGLDVAYRPFGSMQLNISYRDVRSPLQYSQDPMRGFWSR